MVPFACRHRRTPPPAEMATPPPSPNRGRRAATADRQGLKRRRRPSNGRRTGLAHTIRSVMAKNPLLYANFTALFSIEPELLSIEVLHCGNREFRVFFRKIVENVKIFVRSAK